MDRRVRLETLLCCCIAALATDAYLFPCIPQPAFIVSQGTVSTCCARWNTCRSPLRFARVDDDEDSFAWEVDDNGNAAFYREDDAQEVNFSPSGNSSNFTASPLPLEHLSESFAANVSYFYLQNELNLSESALWGVVFDASSALTMRPDVIRRKIDVLQQTANLTMDDVRLLLERKPTTLHLSADRNLSPTILFLQRSLDLSRAELRTLLVECPALLSYSIHNLQTKVLFFTQMMKFSLAEIRALVAKEPRLLRASVATGLVPHMQFWCDDLQFSMDDLRRIVLANPKLLMYSLENNLAPKCIYLLLMTLEMTHQQIQRLLLRYPKFCDQSLERVVLPIVQYFLNDLEFPTYTVATMLVRFPRLVTHSLDGKIKRNIGYLRYELGVSAENVETMLSRAPSLLGLPMVRLRKNVDYLKTLLQNNNEHLQRVLTAMPSLLTVNVEANLEPKVTFLEASDVNVTNLLLKLPASLGYSLQRRLEPRVKALLGSGIDDVNQALPSALPLTDEGFAKRLSIIEKRMEKTRPKPVDASGRITHWVR